MEKMNGAWSRAIDFDTMKKIIDLKSLRHQTDEERFIAVMNCMRNQKGFRAWMYQLQTPRFNKNAKDSTFFRKKANDIYISNARNAITLALEGFTISAAYAPQGSQEMALAYANRSAILLKVQLYEDALLDIARAFKSAYPDRLKTKLFARRAMCLKALRPDETSEIERALENAKKWLRRMEKRHPDRKMVENTVNNLWMMKSLPPPRAKWNPDVFLKDVFEENPGIVGASRSIELLHSQNEGLYVKATRDIKPGEIIAIQEPFVASLGGSKEHIYCDHCFLQTWSGIPCRSCVNRIYCSERCKNIAWSDYHSIECGFIDKIYMENTETDALTIMIMRAMIKSLKEAGSLQGLRDRVRKMDNDPELMRKGFSGSVFDGRTLEAFFTLPTRAAVREPSFLLKTTFMSVYMTFVLATKSKFFGEEMNVQRFLQSEWVPFIGGLLTKFTLIMLGGAQDIFACVDISRHFQFGSTCVPLYLRFPHSCAPNVSFRSFGRKTVVFTHYPIKKGEMIIGCLGNRYEVSVKEKRQKNLPWILGSPCQCIACKENWVDNETTRFDVMKIPPHVLALYETLDNKSDHYFQLIRQGNYPIISKTLHDLAETITQIWKVRKPPCPVLSNLSAYMYRLFSLLGNRYQLIQLDNN